MQTLSSSTASEPQTPAARNFQTALRMSSVLFEDTDRRFGTLSAIPSNVQAIEATLLFACGLNSFVALTGPSGWGKTHLLRSAAYRIDRDREGRTQILSALDWLAYPHIVDPSRPLILDDAQDATHRAKTRIQLRVALERRLRSGRPTIISFTSNGSCREIKQQLPRLRSWVVASISEPAPGERLVVASHLAKTHGLSLSPNLLKLVAKRVPGNGRTLAGAMQRLQMIGKRWISTEECVRGAGVLHSFLADDGSWDLIDRIALAADSARLEPSMRANLLAYVMCGVAQLPEFVVARYLQIEPAKVFQRQHAFERSLVANPRAAQELARYLDSIVELLVRD